MIRAIKIINEYYDIDIREQTRKKEVRQGRQVYLFLMRVLTNYGQQSLAFSVNLKNHATVIHAVKTIQNDMLNDNTLFSDIKYLTEKLKLIYQPVQIPKIVDYDELLRIGQWLNKKGFDLNLMDYNFMDETIEYTIKELAELIHEHHNEIAKKR